VPAVTRDTAALSTEVEFSSANEERSIVVRYEGSIQSGRPTGKLEEFHTGFLAEPSTGKAWGRPVGLAAGRDGSLLVADDAGNRVWRVAGRGAQ
jgi:glucose/arabinose dehydrogenase